MPAEVETMAYAGETPWHGLGVPVSNDMTPQEMMVAAGVDWQVAKFPTFVDVPTGQVTPSGAKQRRQIATGQQTLVRMSDQSILAPQVGPNWEPVQNSEAFAFFNDVVKASKMTMETAGSLKEGKVVWVLAKIDEAFELFGGDRVESHLLFSNFHQYGQSTKIDYTPIRVVCQNTLTLALQTKSGKRIALPHKTKFDVEKAKMLMGVAHEQLIGYKDKAKFLGTHRAEDKEVVEFFQAVFPVAKRGDKEGKTKELSKHAKMGLDLLTTQPGANFAEGSWWPPLNAVTYMVDHILCKTDDQRLYEAWFGAQKGTKDEAMELAMKMAGKSKEMVLA